MFEVPGFGASPITHRKVPVDDVSLWLISWLKVDSSWGYTSISGIESAIAFTSLTVSSFRITSSSSPVPDTSLVIIDSIGCSASVCRKVGSEWHTWINLTVSDRRREQDGGETGAEKSQGGRRIRGEEKSAVCLPLFSSRSLVLLVTLRHQFEAKNHLI